ncbi:hypothetical protein AMTRI_Chr07g80160 [Amborella trichopoda]
MEQHLKLSSENDKLRSNPKSYKRLVGWLIYLTITRPDINLWFTLLANICTNPESFTLQLHKEFYATLKGHLAKDSFLSSNNSLQISDYCDYDWVSCTTTGHSTTGYITYLGTSPVLWRTKKQSTILRLSAEVEYHSMATTAYELTWMKNLFSDLGIHHPQPMHLHCENQVALHIIANSVFHERIKHIEIDFHLIKEKIQNGLIRTSHISTKLQLADILTKALGNAQFYFLLSKLGVLYTHPSA